MISSFSSSTAPCKVSGQAVTHGPGQHSPFLQERIPIPGLTRKIWRLAGERIRPGLTSLFFPVPIVPGITMKPADTICAGMTYTPKATAQQYDSLRWYTYGDGTFSDPTALNPVYTPGSQDIIQGSATLRLSAFSRYGFNIKSMKLIIAGFACRCDQRISKRYGLPFGKP